MDDFDKLLASIVRSGKREGTERKLIVLHNKACYHHCLLCLKKIGIKPVKKLKGLHAISCHISKGADLELLLKHSMVKRIEDDLKVKQHRISEVLNSASAKRRKPGGASCKSTPRGRTERPKLQRSTVKIRQLRRISTIRLKNIPWGIRKVNAPKVWTTTQGNGIRVAVLDTGISRHPDLQASGGFNTINRKKAIDDNGHGTHVAGIIGALRNSFGVVGIAPKVKLFAVKALDRNGEGYISDIIEGIEWCMRHNIRVINMSLGMSDRSEALHDIIKKAHKRGIVMVASNGNSGMESGQVDYPARFPETIAVAAATANNQIADFSSRGPGVDIAAPGDDIRSTYLHSQYRKLDGTSMAAPHVTGAVALLLRLRPGLTPNEVQSILQKTAVPLKGSAENDQGAGLLNVQAAVRLVKSMNSKARLKSIRKSRRAAQQKKRLSPLF